MLDNYFASAIELLKPRFQHVVYMHVQSLKAVEPSRLQSLDHTPHYITRRFAEFFAGFVAIQLESGADTTHADLFTSILLQLKQEMDGLLLRMAAEFRERKHQLVFLINNYDMVQSVMLERLASTPSATAMSGSGTATSASGAVTGTAIADCRELLAVRDSLNQRVGEYVEELLSHHFGELIEFVKSGERLVGDSSCAALSNAESDRVVRLVRQFNATWKKATEDLNGEIMRSFSNFRNGTSILQVSVERETSS